MEDFSGAEGGGFSSLGLSSRIHREGLGYISRIRDRYLPGERVLTISIFTFLWGYVRQMYHNLINLEEGFSSSYVG